MMARHHTKPLLQELAMARCTTQVPYDGAVDQTLVLAPRAWLSKLSWDLFGGGRRGLGVWVSGSACYGHVLGNVDVQRSSRDVITLGKGKVEAGGRWL